MKKTLIYFILMMLFISGSNGIAVETTQNKTSDGLKGAETILDNSSFKIVKKGGKFGVYDVKSQTYFIKPVLDEIKKLADSNIEYKIKSKDMIGYTNLEEKTAFLTYFDDITSMNKKYLIVKKDNNVGIVDKKGKVLVPAEYKKVSVTKYDETEYLIGKSEGRYDVYYSDGKVVSKSNLTTTEKIAQKISLLRNLNPILKKYRTEQEKNDTVYMDDKYVIEPDGNETTSQLTPIADFESLQTSETGFEIDALPIPGTIRDKNGEVPNRYEDKTSIIASNYEEEQQPEIEIEPTFPSNVRKLSVRHEDYVQLNNSDNDGDSINVITLNSKPYIVIENNGRYGMQTTHGREIIPARYKALKIKTLEKNSHEIIAAVDSRNTKLYDTNGDILARRFHDKISVYTSMRKYDYYKDGEVYAIDFNGRKVGEIELYDDGTYLYTRTGFNLSNMNKANELFINLIEAEKD